jgi:serine/threonine-protein kinase
VLPFEDPRESGSQAHFSLGMTDELITTLSRLPGLRVAARTSSSMAKARGGDARSIGALHVDAFLDGAFAVPAIPCVSVQLVNTSDGSTAGATRTTARCETSSPSRNELPAPSRPPWRSSSRPRASWYRGQRRTSMHTSST